MTSEEKVTLLNLLLCWQILISEVGSTTYRGSHSSKDDGGEQAVLGGDRGPHELGVFGPEVPSDGSGDWGHEARPIAFQYSDGHRDEDRGVLESLGTIAQATEHLLDPAKEEMHVKSSLKVTLCTSLRSPVYFLDDANDHVNRLELDQGVEDVTRAEEDQEEEDEADQHQELVRESRKHRLAYRVRFFQWQAEMSSFGRPKGLPHMYES